MFLLVMPCMHLFILHYVVGNLCSIHLINGNVSTSYVNSGKIPRLIFFSNKESRNFSKLLKLYVIICQMMATYFVLLMYVEKIYIPCNVNRFCHCSCFWLAMRVCKVSQYNKVSTILLGWSVEYIYQDNTDRYNSGHRPASVE